MKTKNKSMKKCGLRFAAKEESTLAFAIVNENKGDTHDPVREVEAIKEVG